MPWGDRPLHAFAGDDLACRGRSIAHEWAPAVVDGTARHGRVVGVSRAPTGQSERACRSLYVRRLKTPGWLPLHVLEGPPRRPFTHLRAHRQAPACVHCLGFCDRHLAASPSGLCRPGTFCQRGHKSAIRGLLSSLLTYVTIAHLFRELRVTKRFPTVHPRPLKK